MIDTGMHTVAQIKLAELGRQRLALRSLYEQTLSDAQRALTPLEQLKTLYHGLLQARLGQSMLHPDVAQLKDVLYTIPTGGPSTASVLALCQQLSEEVERGRLRADYAWSFSNLLTEWTQSPNADPNRPEPQRTELLQSLLARWKQPLPPIDLTVIDEAFGFFPEVLGLLQEKVRQFAQGEALEELTPREIDSCAEMLAISIYRTPSLRTQAEAAAKDDIQKAEYASAITLMKNRLSEWRWPAKGVMLRTLWTKTKWRPYLEEDLFTALFLQSTGNAWCEELGSICREHLSGHGGPLAQDTSEERSGGVVGSIERHFEQNWLGSLASVDSDSGRGFYDAADVSFEHRYALETNLAAVNAILQVERLTKPNEPLFVMRLDLKELHLTLPHEAVLRALSHLGVPPEWRGFFAQFMKATLSHNQETFENPIGVFPDHSLSLVCIEAVLMALDLYVKKVAGARMWRVLDDIFLIERSEERLTRSFEAIQTFCRALGMSLNLEKCGAVALRGTLPPNVPSGKVRAGFLSLQPDGTWLPDEEAIAPLTARLCSLLLRSPSILEKTARYSSYMRFLLRGLAPFSKLSSEHLARIGAYLSRLHGNLFGEGKGIEEHLLQEIERRFFSGESALQRFPRECLYWPLTAGGVGLIDPLAVLAPLHASRRQRNEKPDQWNREVTPPEAPTKEDWRTDERSPWLNYFHHLLSQEDNRRPWLTPNQKAMLQDFYHRGAELRGEEPDEDKDPEDHIDNYWQWIICLYGPGLISRFGTLRFLEVALVPRFLILQSKVGTSSLSEPADL